MRSYTFYIIGSFLLGCIAFYGCNGKSSGKNELLVPKDPIAFSQNFLLDVKSGKSVSEYLDTLKKMDNLFLSKELGSDSDKNAFWINCYNALIQTHLKNDPSSFDDHDAFFNKRNIVIGYVDLSFNDLENGILRAKKIIEKEKFTKLFRPEQFDYRIHFALNCGAASCPPIAYYNSKDLDQQLHQAEKSFLKSEVEYDSLKNEVYISELFKWYSDDFGGEKGILEILKRNQAIPIWCQPKIVYAPYDWSIYSLDFIQ